MFCIVTFPQVQSDLEVLDINMEDDEDPERTKSEVKLAKLQFTENYSSYPGQGTK